MNEECKNHGAHPVEYHKEGSEYRAFYCGGWEGCGKDLELTNDVLNTLGEYPKPEELECLKFGCFVEIDSEDFDLCRVLLKTGICKKGHKSWATCEKHECDDFTDALFLLWENDEGSYYTTTLPYERIFKIMCPPDCKHREKTAKEKIF